MTTPEELNDAIDVAIGRTKQAQERVGVDLDQGNPASGDAAKVARRADDLDQLVTEATALADETDEDLRRS